MVNIGEVRERLEKYLAGAGSLEDFAYWLSRESSSIPYDADPELFDLVAAILNLVQVNFDGNIDNALLRDELSKLKNQRKVPEYIVHFVFDDFPVREAKPDVLELDVNSQVASAMVAA